ncbi:MAG: N-acetyltransferase [Woeseiaceae bacterium]
MSIRNFAEADWPAVWAVMEPVFRAGDTYSFASDISEQDARRAWIDDPARSFVAVDDAGHILGTYFLKANRPGQGGHVCNCGYIVAASARGRGIASAMCEHSQREAVRLGFRAMQYNLVVSTNTGALSLWRKLGFDIVGTLPEAFLHPTKGYVDAHVLYKMLQT